MDARARFLVALVATLLASFVLIAGGGAASPSGAKPTLYFTYAMNCTFVILNDQGQQVSSIAPGTYQVDVRTPVAFGTVPLAVEGITDMTACKGFPQFQLTGPGVDLFTTMTAGCQSDLTFLETFQPSQTYVAQDLNQPSVTRTVLSVAASGTPQAPPVSYGKGPTKVESQQDIVGSAADGGLPKIAVSVAANGKVTLRSNGKAVTTLTPGRYVFAITDKDPHAAFSLLGPKTTTKLDLTTPSFVGTRSTAVKLTAGRWAYLTGLGNLHFFVVAR